MDLPLGAMFDNRTKGSCHLSNGENQISLLAVEDESVHKVSVVNNLLRYICI